MNLNKEIVEGMYIALIFIAGYYLVKTKRINILWKILAAVNILSWACLLVILALVYWIINNCYIKLKMLQLR